MTRHLLGMRSGSRRRAPLAARALGELADGHAGLARLHELRAQVERAPRADSRLGAPRGTASAFG